MKGKGKKMNDESRNAIGLVLGFFAMIIVGVGIFAFTSRAVRLDGASAEDAAVVTYVAQKVCSFEEEYRDSSSDTVSMISPTTGNVSIGTVSNPVTKHRYYTVLKETKENLPKYFLVTLGDSYYKEYLQLSGAENLTLTYNPNSLFFLWSINGVTPYDVKEITEDEAQNYRRALEG